MNATEKLLDQTTVDNPKSFRIFSPDELESNKLWLVAVLDHTGPNFKWDEFSNGRGESSRFSASIHVRVSWKDAR